MNMLKAVGIVLGALLTIPLVILFIYAGMYVIVPSFIFLAIIIITYRVFKENDSSNISSRATPNSDSSPK